MKRLLLNTARRAVAAVMPPAVPASPPTDHRSSPATKAALLELMLAWQSRARQGPLDLRDAGLRVFSQFEEDGILLAIFAAIGTTNRIFVDIGASDENCNNTANLAVNFGWHGLMIDGDADQVAKGRAWFADNRDTFHYPPVARQAMLNRENVDEVIRDAGFFGPIDFLNIDIDGNDYWILDAITIVDPRVVLVESNAAFGSEPVTIPYDPNFVHSEGEYFGASGEAFRRLMTRKGYRLVAASRFGFNLFFVKNGVGESELPAIAVPTPETHTRMRDFVPAAWASVKDRPFVRV